eukprot:3568856-Rhodomonas_salina.1
MRVLPNSDEGACAAEVLQDRGRSERGGLAERVLAGMHSVENKRFRRNQSLVFLMSNRQA